MTKTMRPMAGGVRMRGRLAITTGLAVCLWVGAAQAMDWRWTEGQGWAQSLGVARATAREQLGYAYQLEQNRDYYEAARQYLLYLRQYGDTDPDNAGRALVRLGRCLHMTDNQVAAFQALEMVIRDYPGAATRVDLLRMELMVGKNLMNPDATGSLLNAPGDPQAANRRQAAQIFRAVADHDPYGPVAPEALYYLGMTLTLLEDTVGARAAFQQILDRHPQSEFVEHARLGLMRLDQTSPGATYELNIQDQLQTVREIEIQKAQQGDLDALRQFEEMQRQTSEKKPAEMLQQAEEYRKMKFPNALRAADFLYNEIIYTYPRSPQAQIARERLGNLKAPKGEGFIERRIKVVDPREWFKSDSRPDWEVPRLSPEDEVAASMDVGPIPGVAGTGTPPPGDATPLMPSVWETAQAPSQPPPLPTPGGTSAPPMWDGGGSDADLWSDSPTASNLDFASSAPVAPPAPAPPFSRPNPLPEVPDSDLVSLPDLAPSRAARPAPSASEYVPPAAQPSSSLPPTPMPGGMWTVSEDFR